jgi:hypothetical protein
MGITGLAQTLVGLGRGVAATSTLLIRLCTLWFGIAVGIMALLVLSRIPRQFENPSPTEALVEAS